MTECEKAYKISRSKIKQCIISGEIYKDLKFKIDT